MQSLSFERDVNGFVFPTAKITLRAGSRELWLCNPWEELRDAMDAGKPFEAQTVVGMHPKPLIVNPAHVALVETA